MAKIKRRVLLRNAYNLLGDGMGGEWNENPEYTRGVLELVRDCLGIAEGNDLDDAWIEVQIRTVGAEVAKPTVLTHDQSARLFALVADLQDSIDGAGIETWIETADIRGVAARLDLLASEIDPANSAVER